jgi:hypothetical protein
VSAGAQLGRLQSDMAWISTDLANYVRVRVAQIESGAAAGDAGGALDDRGGGGGGGSELSRLARTHSRARRGLGSELGRDDDDDDDADSDDADLDERSTAAAEAAAAEAAEAAEAAAAAAARARAPVKLSDRIPLHARGTRAPHAATRGLVARLARTHTPSAPDEGSSDSAASSDAESAGESAGGDRGLTLLATRGRALGLTAVRAALVQRYARSAWRLPAKLDEVSATQTQTQRQPPTRPRRSDAASQDSAASSPATQPRDRALSRLHVRLAPRRRACTRARRVRAASACAARARVAASRPAAHLVESCGLWRARVRRRCPPPSARRSGEARGAWRSARPSEARPRTQPPRTANPTTTTTTTTATARPRLARRRPRGGM